MAGQEPGRVQGGGGGACHGVGPGGLAALRSVKAFRERECPFVSEQRARLALMRQLFVAGLSTSSGLVDSLT